MIKGLVFAGILYVSNAVAQNYQAVGTWFDGIATPYGGCGVPENRLDSPNYVALDVYDSPGVGTMWPRPLRGADTVYMGEYQNGRNCGRWVRVTIQENCINGLNDGALGQPFCRNGGSWQNDGYSGATMDLLVTDACGDNNAWCRDSKYHLDIRRSALTQFTMQNGQPSTNLVPTNWNNRKISWHYIEAPNYQGDVKIYMLQASQYYWPAITITNLKNGIHGVQQLINGQWVNLKMNSDMGQSYILEITNQPYTIRIIDASNNYVNGGREYTFNNPCNPQPCQPVTTPINYNTKDPVVLPIDFIRTKLKYVNDNLFIDCKVQYSENGSFFILAGNEFSEMEILKEIKASEGPRQDYSFEINDGYNYYMIYFEDSNGAITRSNVLYKGDNHIEGRIKQLDNRLVLHGFETQVAVSFYDMNLKHIANLDLNQPEIELGNLNRGIYIVQIQDKKQLVRQKVVVW